MLSRLQLQSSSDQTDYKLYPAIITGALAGVLPEQLAAWSYPLEKADADAASFNMVSAMLCRVHQSGCLSKLSPEAFAEVQSGLRIYKQTIRRHLPRSLPFFPLGLPKITDHESPVALGMRSSEATFLAVWRLRGSRAVAIPAGLRNPRILYPLEQGIQLLEGDPGSPLKVVFPREYMGAILRADA
jgi:alpha-galactosidase